LSSLLSFMCESVCARMHTHVYAHLHVCMCMCLRRSQQHIFFQDQDIHPGNDPICNIIMCRCMRTRERACVQTTTLEWWEAECTLYTHTYTPIYLLSLSLHTHLDQKKPPPRGGFLFTMFPDQEPGGRGPPSKNLYQVLRGGSSFPGFLIREQSK